MKLLNWLKKLIWGETDDDDGTMPPEQKNTQPFEPCAGKVILVKPDLYINVGLLTSYLCAGYLVMIDLSGVSDEGARRIVDFLSGAAYGRDGIMRQVASRAYLLAPSCVSVDDWNDLKGDPWEYENAFNF